MLILTGLPASWDGIQSTILANHAVDTLTAESVIPILQEEWKRRQARRSDKLAHFVKTNLHGGPQCQQWQGQQNSYNNNYQQAGPSSYNRPAPYQKKFGPKPNYQKPNLDIRLQLNKTCQKDQIGHIIRRIARIKNLQDNSWLIR